MVVRNYQDSEDNLDFKDSKDILVNAIFEEEPQDLYQLEDMTGLDKNSIDICLTELEREKIVRPRYDGKQLYNSSGISTATCVYYLSPLWRTVCSILSNSEAW